MWHTDGSSGRMPSRGAPSFAKSANVKAVRKSFTVYFACAQWMRLIDHRFLDAIIRRSCAAAHTPGSACSAAVSASNTGGHARCSGRASAASTCGEAARKRRVACAAETAVPLAVTAASVSSAAHSSSSCLQSQYRGKR